MTRAERLHLQVLEQERREEQKKATENAMALVKIDNIIYMIKDIADSAKTPIARTEIQNSADVILRMINDSLNTWNEPKFTADELSKWMTKHDRGIERLALAIYDEEYNTNTRYYEKDEQGNKGRMAYFRDMRSLANSLKVPLPTLYFLSDV